MIASSHPSPSTSNQLTPGPNWLSLRESSGCRAKSSKAVSTWMCCNRPVTSMNQGSGADTLDIWRHSAQAHRDTRRAALVSIKQGGRIQAIDDDIQISIIIQIGQRHPLGDLAGVETPALANFFESQVAQIVKRDIGD